MKKNKCYKVLTGIYEDYAFKGEERVIQGENRIVDLNFNRSFPANNCIEVKNVKGEPLEK